MKRITPDDYAWEEDQFVAFCDGQGIPGGHLSGPREDPAYRTALIRTQSWRRNEFDTWALLPPDGRLALFDQKTVTETNSGTGYASIELRSIRAGLLSELPAFYVRPPDWDWIAVADVLPNRARGGCCDDHVELALDDRWDELPEKCPRFRGRGSNDPWMKISVEEFSPWVDLIRPPKVYVAPPKVSLMELARSAMRDLQ